MTNADDLPQPGMYIPHQPGNSPENKRNRTVTHNPGITKKKRLKYSSSGGSRRKKRKTTKKKVKRKTNKKSAKKKVKRKIYTGPRGGRYYRKGGRKVYI